MAAHVDPVAWAKKKKRLTIIWVSIAAFLIVGTVSFLLMKNRIIPAIAYARAEAALDRGETETAVERFYAIGSYKDADARGAAIASAFGENAALLEQFKAASVHDVVRFGHYEQDNNRNNGTEPIAWYVLAKENGRMLLISAYCLDNQVYHDEGGFISWEQCTLRTWLNHTFLHTAFTAEEQLLIPTVALENKANPASGASAGKNTKDRVFVMSFDDVTAYAPVNGDFPLWTYPTDYAAAQGLTPHSEYGTGYWWMRTPGTTRDTVMYVDMRGSALHARRATAECGVRPVIWVVIGE